jgi:hypothetical protein
MRYILRAFIILMITITTSACFDNLYNLQIDGVLAVTIADDGTCTYDYSADGTDTLYHTEGMMDLAYTKLSGSSMGIYGYRITLGVKNLLEIQSSDTANSNVNSIHIRQANVKTYSETGALLDTETINIDFTVSAEGVAVIPLRLFSNKLKWEIDENGDTIKGRDALYSSFYYASEGITTTNHVIVDIQLIGDTLGGEYVTTDHFKYKINLCIDCLLCPINILDTPDTTPSCQSPLSLNDACLQNYNSPLTNGPTCGLYQDAPISAVQCGIVEETTGK